MSDAFFKMWNQHNPSCGEPTKTTNESGNKYYGYFQNRFGEQWILVYDHEKKIGELRGGDIVWDTVVIVEDGQVDVMLGKAEAAWLQACWKAATFVG